MQQEPIDLLELQARFSTRKLAWIIWSDFGGPRVILVLDVGLESTTFTARANCISAACVSIRCQ